MGLRKRQVFVSPSSGGWKMSSRIRLPAESALDEGLLPGLSSAAFLLRSHMAFPWCILEREREREHPGVSSSSYEDTDPTMCAPSS